MCREHSFHTCCCPCQVCNTALPSPAAQKCWGWSCSVKHPQQQQLPLFSVAKTWELPGLQSCRVTAATWSCYMARFTTHTALEGCHMTMQRISGGFFSCEGSFGTRGFVFSLPSAWKGAEEPLRAQQHKQLWTKGGWARKSWTCAMLTDCGICICRWNRSHES